MSSDYETGYNYPCKRNSDGEPVNTSGVCDRQVQTDDDDLEGSWEKLKDDYLEESACSICLENYVTSGQHQVALLKCGHIFGDYCIKRWLNEAKNDGVSKCPTCKSKAKVNDIKLIIPRAFKKSDPSVVEKFMLEAGEIKRERLKVQSELDDLNIAIEKLKNDLKTYKHALATDTETLNSTLKRINDQHLAAAKAGVTANKLAKQQKSILQPLALGRRLDLEPGSDSRVCALSDMFGIIMIAQKKNVNGSTYGLTNIGTGNFKSSGHTELHQDKIKDIAFHPFDGLVLSASMDKTVKLTEIFSCSEVMRFSFDEPIWSCCWNEVDTNVFFAGLRNGNVHEYDKRSGGQPVAVIQAPDSSSRTPCVSLNFVCIDQFTGLITTRLRNSTFSYQSSPGTYNTLQLPISGNFMSSHFERKTAKLLYSARPSRSTPQVTHSIYSVSLLSDLLPSQPMVNCVNDKCFYGGSHADQVTKTRIFAQPHRENSSLVFAGDQDIGGLIVWDALTGEPVQKLGGIGLAFDIALTNQCNSPAFIVLTDKTLFHYNWTLN